MTRRACLNKPQRSHVGINNVVSSAWTLFLISLHSQVDVQCRGHHSAGYSGVSFCTQGLEKLLKGHVLILNGE